MAVNAVRSVGLRNCTHLFRRVAVVAAVALLGAASAPRPAWMNDPAYGQPVDLSARPSLQDTVTIERDDITMRDLLAWLNAEHQVRVQAEPAAPDKHLAVFVKDRPLWQLLGAVSGALDGHWRLSLNNLWLRLSEPPDDAEALSTHFRELIARDQSTPSLFPWDPIPDAEETDATGQQHMIRISDPNSPGPAVAKDFGSLFAALTEAERQALSSDAGLHDSALSAEQRATLVGALRDMTLAPAIREFVNPALGRFSNQQAPGDETPVRAWWILRGGPGAMGPGGAGGGEDGSRVALAGSAELMGGRSQMSMNTMPRDEIPIGPDEGIALGSGEPGAGNFGMALQGYLQQKLRERGLTMPTPRRPQFPTPPTRFTAMATPPEGSSEAVQTLFKTLADERDMAGQFDSLAALAKAGAEALAFPLVVPLDGVTGAVTLGTPKKVSLREWLRASEKAIPGVWTLEGDALFFRRTIPVEPLEAFATAFGADHAVRVPRAWVQRRREIEQQLQQRGETEPPMAGWPVLRRMLTDRQWDTLRSDVLLWEDLSGEQQQAYTNAEWDRFVWDRTMPIPPSIQALVRGDSNAGLALGGGVTLWLRDEEQQLRLHIGMADGQTLTYRVPPGVERRLHGSGG